jgi:type I restriction enzyme M protein
VPGDAFRQIASPTEVVPLCDAISARIQGLPEWSEVLLFCAPTPQFCALTIDATAVNYRGRAARRDKLVADRGANLLTEKHDTIASTIWEVANRLRGPYRPPQYRLVMLPLVVLRRLDCVLEPTKAAVLAEHKRLLAANTSENAIPRLLTRVVDKNRKQPLYNVSPYTFQTLLGDSENIAPNLVSYINGFSATVRQIFEKFKFGEQLEKLDASNRLYNIIKAMSEINLHPDNGIDNLQMGYLFEHLIMRFNEQADEEAGDHFTPREVIRLMTHLVYTGEEDVYKPGVYREVFDPACGTGGMLSVSEETIRAQNLSGA